MLHYFCMTQETVRRLPKEYIFILKCQHGKSEYPSSSSSKGVQVCGIVAVRTTVNNLCMILMANVAEFIMRPMGIPIVRYVSFGS